MTRHFNLRRVNLRWGWSSEISVCRWGQALFLFWAGWVYIYLKMWFTFSKPQVPNSLSPDLVISPVHLKDAGFYICRVNCGDAFEFSQWAQVDVLDVAMPYGKILHKSHSWLLFPALCAVFINVLLLLFSFHLNLKLEHFSQWDKNLFELDVVDNILMMSPLPPPPGQSYHSLEGRLKLVIQPQSQRLNVGENLQLECGAVGRPIPRYQWHRNGAPVLNATKRKLTVRRL